MEDPLVAFFREHPSAMPTRLKAYASLHEAVLAMWTYAYHTRSPNQGAARLLHALEAATVFPIVLDAEGHVGQAHRLLKRTLEQSPARDLLVRDELLPRLRALVKPTQAGGSLPEQSVYRHRDPVERARDHARYADMARELRRAVAAVDAELAEDGADARALVEEDAYAQARTTTRQSRSD